MDLWMDSKSFSDIQYSHATLRLNLPDWQSSLTLKFVAKVDLAMDFKSFSNIHEPLQEDPSRVDQKL